MLVRVVSKGLSDAWVAVGAVGVISTLEVVDGGFALDPGWGCRLDDGSEAMHGNVSTE